MDSAETSGREPPRGIATSVSHSARVWNYWLGGKDNYPFDHYIDADLRDPDTILRQAARTLDFTQPIALMLLGVVEHIMDTDQAYTIVHRLLDVLPSGSYLVLCDVSAEADGVIFEACRLWNESGGIPPVVARSRPEIARFFDRVELLEPGLVSSALWRPGPSDIAPRPRCLITVAWGESPDDHV